MNFQINPRSHLLVAGASAVVFLCATPFLFDMRLIDGTIKSLIFMIIFIALLVYSQDLLEFKISKYLYPSIAAIAFTITLPLLNAIGTTRSIKIADSETSIVTTWYATGWVQLLIILGLLIVGHLIIFLNNIRSHLP